MSLQFKILIFALIFGALSLRVEAQTVSHQREIKYDLNDVVGLCRSRLSEVPDFIFLGFNSKAPIEEQVLWVLLNAHKMPAARVSELIIMRETRGGQFREEPRDYSVEELLQGLIRRSMHLFFDRREAEFARQGTDFKTYVNLTVNAGVSDALIRQASPPDLHRWKRFFSIEENDSYFDDDIVDHLLTTFIQVLRHSAEAEKEGGFSQAPDFIRAHEDLTESLQQSWAGREFYRSRLPALRAARWVQGVEDTDKLYHVAISYFERVGNQETLKRLRRERREFRKAVKVQARAIAELIEQTEIIDLDKDLRNRRLFNIHMKPFGVAVSVPEE